MEKIKIRIATPNDAKEILDIYTPFIIDTPVTFEYDVPSIQSFEDRIHHILQTHPYIVCEIDGAVAGYAYAHTFRERTAFQWDTELSVYVSPAFHGRGIATALYACLLDFLSEMGFYNAFAVITTPNDASISFHYSFGFKEMGLFKNVGFKHNKWHDLIWLCKTLAPFTTEAQPPKTFNNLSTDFIQQTFNKALFIIKEG